MKRTLEVLNELEQKGHLARYAIGDAMGATFYVEPLLTFDLDVFVVLPRTAGGLLAAKEDRRRKLSALPFPEKVRAVVRMQEMVAPLLRARGRQVRVWSLHGSAEPD